MCTNNSKQAQIRPDMFNTFKLVHTQPNTPEHDQTRPKTPADAPKHPYTLCAQTRPITPNHTQTQRNAPRHAQTFPDRLVHSQLRRNPRKQSKFCPSTPKHFQTGTHKTFITFHGATSWSDYHRMPNES
jgi:hypothetical protein